MSSRRGDGCEETVRLFSCRGIRTSGVVGSQWLGLGWRARVAFSFLEMSQDFPNHLLLGDEGDDAIGASAVALKRIGLMNALDELCPSFPERGTLFGGQLRLRLGFGVLLAGERLQRAVFPFSKGARSRGVGAHVVHAVLPRLGDLREDSGQELEDIEGLASRMRSEGVVM